ncbi:PAS domain S-box protein [Chitinophaga sp. GCM10012297]|uniref:histidine kinase n=1 Tax=Chitinophaga chungangae TaxID=2821488 RepID=A0ABS3YEE4_9BACT|nr:PAS domain S-box protein [Chitinophaga chungangae]MBO9153050.1 PAS domain S-box protein [Chitinophaga chungangae]
MKKISSPVIIVFVAAIVSVAWFAWSAWFSDADAIRRNERIQLTNDKIRLLERVALTVKSLESSVRAYVITGDSGFLSRENFTEAQLRTPVENLQFFASGNPQEARAMDSLRAMVYQRIVYFNYLISSARESPIIAAAMIRPVQTPAPPDPLTQLTERLLNQQYALMESRLSRSIPNRLPFLATLAASALALIIICWGLYRLVRDMRRAKATETVLRASEAKYRKLVEDAGATMFTTNRGGFFKYVNAKAYDLTGYTPQELLDKQYIMLIDPPEQQRIREHYEKQAFEGHNESTLRFPIRCKNGERKWVEQHVVLTRQSGIFSGYQCIVKDIHARKMADEEIVKTKNEMNILHSRLQSILLNTPSMIFIKDINGKYVLVNKRFEEVFGIKSENILGRADKDFPTKLKPEKSIESDREVLLHERPVESEDSIEIDGKTHYFFLTKFPLRDHTNRVYGLCGIATDITERIQHEHALIDERKKAIDARRAQEFFMANMSHELRTPLNGILGFTYLLDQTPTSEIQAEYVREVLDSANHLLALVNDLLDFSRIKAGHMVLEHTAIDLGELVAQQTEKYRQRAEGKGLQLFCDIQENMENKVLGDPLRLKQVLDNLLDNAVKFTDEGSVRLTVNVSEENEKQVKYLFEVADTGIGIPQHLHHEMGTTFAQVHAGNDRKHGGTGLGLALVRQLVELQQGKVHIRNNPEGGTIIRFSIPYNRQAREPVPVPAASNGALLLPPLQGKNILLAEDNLVNQKLAIRTLANAGAAVELAENGVEALEKLRSHKYDCILMDIQMPQMDGLEATRKIRDGGSSIPIIAMTASALKGDRERCLMAGMNDYISKPFIPNELFQKILEALGERDPVQHKFTGPDYEEQKVPSMVDLHYLRSVAGDSREYMLDILNTFLERTSGMLCNLENSAQLEDWDETSQHASLLRSSLMVVRIHPMLEMIIEIEQQARNRESLHTILSNIHLAVKLYKDAHAVLQKEVNKLS